MIGGIMTERMSFDVLFQFEDGSAVLRPHIANPGDVQCVIQDAALIPLAGEQVTFPEQSKGAGPVRCVVTRRQFSFCGGMCTVSVYVNPE
jgi:hypothetical protein